MKTVNPVFEQLFNFKHITYSQLTSSYVHLKVYDYDRFSGHDLLGEAKVPVIDLDLNHPVEETRILQPEFKFESKGVRFYLYILDLFIVTKMVVESYNGVPKIINLGLGNQIVGLRCLSY